MDELKIAPLEDLRRDLNSIVSDCGEPDKVILEAKAAIFALDAFEKLGRRATPENDHYMEGVKYAIYEIFKEADIPGSQEIRDSGDTDDGMCVRAAEKIRAELTATPENKPLAYSINFSRDEITEFRHYLNAVKNMQTLKSDIRMSAFKLLHKFTDTAYVREPEGSEI